MWWKNHFSTALTTIYSAAENNKTLINCVYEDGFFAILYDDSVNVFCYIFSQKHLINFWREWSFCICLVNRDLYKPKEEQKTLSLWFFFTEKSILFIIFLLFYYNIIYYKKKNLQCIKNSNKHEFVIFNSFVWVKKWWMDLFFFFKLFIWFRSLYYIIILNWIEISNAKMLNTKN